MKDPALALERAQSLIEEGRPAAALKLLNGAAPALYAKETAFLRAEALRAQGFFESARPIYERLLPGADRGLRFDAALALAAVHRSLGQTEKARRRWLQAKAASSGPDRRLDVEDALIDRAAGAWGRCLAKLERLRRQAEKEGDAAQAAFLLWASGGARRFSGDLAGSQRDFERSLTLARRAGDPAGEAYALFGLGGVTRIRGLLKESERHYAAAKRKLAATDDVFGKAYAHCGLANSLRQQGRLDEARVLYLQAHVLYSSLGDAVDLAYVDWGLGKIALQKGELSAAERHLRLALAGFEPEEHRGASLSMMALASALHALGRTREAEKLFDAGVRRSRKAALTAHLESFT